MEKLNIGGVPEHFNIPWNISVENKEFEKENILVEWIDYPGGTGAMANDLRNGKLDVAVLLTEGIVADISKGNPSRIISQYVSSPLIWGIHVPSYLSINSIDEIKDRRYAISRIGSGSHLMAYVNAMQRGWKIAEAQFVVVGNINGAREAFKNKDAEVFMWEKFMTQPLVDSGEFNRVGECPTPWPCFVIAARNEVIEKKPEVLRKMLLTIKRSCESFMKNPVATSMVVDRFGLEPEQAEEWFSITQWNAGTPLSPETFNLVANTLLDLKLIHQNLDVRDGVFAV